MAEYTLELRDVIQHYHIFNFPYEFYNEHKRKEFEESFIRHFYFREIGSRTPERFIWYLEDKMRTVFPYYNELFKTAEIEYSVLDNYNVTESFERTSERSEKGAGFSSTVGQVLDKQNSESEQTRNGESNTALNMSGQNNENETTNTEVDTVGKNKTNETDNLTTTGSREESSENTVDRTATTDKSETVDKRFLDTPQGLLDLKDSKYLTTLNLDKTDGLIEEDENTSTEGTLSVSENGSNNRTIDKTENVETNTITEGNRNVSGTSSQNQSGTTTSTDDAKTSSNFEGEQRTTNDNNTRTESKGEHHEEYKLIRKGNIGVDTDADMIQKHINLQKVLTRIQMMFFDECEDLFMMVY